MQSLEGIIAQNRSKPTKPATETRKHGFHFLPSCQALILHSATHRCTEYHSADASSTVFPKNGYPYQRKNQYSRDVYFAAQYWLAQSETAAQAFIEHVFDGGEIERAERAAFVADRPGWSVHRNKGTGKNRGQGEIVARRQSGACVESIGAFSWRHLHAKTGGDK